MQKIINQCSFYVLVVAIAVVLLGTGCQTYTATKKPTTVVWETGSASIAADQLGKKADACDPNHMVVWHLEAGTAYRAAGDVTNSNRHLNDAAKQMDKFEDQAKIRPVNEFIAFISNQQNLPYEGRGYDKIMLYTYKALNYLGAGEIEKARPEITHAYQCQQDAVEQNNRRIEKAQEAASKSKQRKQIETAQANPKYAQALNEGTKDLEGFKFYADYVNPFTVYLKGLYFLYAGVDAADLELARNALKKVQEVAGSNEYVQADIQLAEAAGITPPTPSPCTYVILETGEAASFDQIKIDIPIMVTKVSSLHVAFPKLVVHNDYVKQLTVKAGELEKTTTPIAGMDSIVALDFKNEWPIILTKTMISTASKAAATAAINNALEKKGGVWGNILTKIVLVAVQATVNVADTRSWTTLPKEFQVCRVATPSDRKIVLSSPGSPPMDVNLVDGTVNVVYVRSINVSSPLLVSQFKLK